MLRLFFSLCLALSTASTGAMGMASSNRVARQIQKAITLEARAEHADRSLTALIRVADFVLRAHGYEEDADEVTSGWEFYRGEYWDAMMAAEDLGDHQGLSNWLTAVYFLLEARLGTQLMEVMHLDDIFVYNHGFTVFFKPYASAQWCTETYDKPCQEEFSLHAVPFLGVNAYWLTFWPCFALTSGTLGAICTPAAMIAERLVTRVVAPRLSDKIWLRHNPL